MTEEESVSWASPDGMIKCRVISEAEFHEVTVDVDNQRVYSHAHSTLAEAMKEAERLRALFLGEVAH
jgi:hypothetical protein